MKKLFAVLLAGVLVLGLLLSPMGSAEDFNFIIPMASPVDPEHLEKAACYARILDYDEEMHSLTVELIIPEVFAAEDVQALAVGDVICTGDEQITVEILDRYDEYGYLVINEGDVQHAPGSVYLFEDRDGNWRPKRYGHPTYNELDVLECPVTDSLLLLDYTSADTGDPLDIPIVSTAAEFTAAMQKTAALREEHIYSVGFARDNVYVVFDGDGQLAVICRYFVSWQ